MTKIKKVKKVKKGKVSKQASIKKMVEKSEFRKTVKADARTERRADRISTNLSLEPFNGCWIGFGYESDMKPGETIDQAKKRIWDVVVETVHKRSKEIAEER